MTADITYNGHMLVCRIEGMNSESNVLRYLDAIDQAMLEHRCGRVLIVEDLKGPGLSLLQIYHVIRKARKTILSHPHAIAYIDANPEHDRRRLRFAETVALNRFIHMRLFHDEAEAAAWLERIRL